MRVLVVEDNSKLAERIRQRLVQEGFNVEVVSDGHDAEEKASIGTYDVVVLDTLLPDHDGVTVCRNLRRRKVNSPILMLTVLSATSDKVTALEAGADDYMTKPFESDELVARVRALMRRSHAGEAVTLRYEDIEMDLTKRFVSRGGRKIELTAREFALLEYFLRHPERVLTRSAIGESVWDMNFEDESNVIEVYISRLRRKLENGSGTRLIHTIPGAGYMLTRANEPVAQAG